jgi:hypothetical protein
LVVWNAQTSYRLGSRNSSSEKSTFDGFTVRAAPEVTICGGKVVFKNSKLTGDKTESHFVALKPNAPHVFSVVQLREKMMDLGKPENVRKDSIVSNGSSGSGVPDGSRGMPLLNLKFMILFV